MLLKELADSEQNEQADAYYALPATLYLQAVQAVHVMLRGAYYAVLYLPG